MTAMTRAVLFDLDGTLIDSAPDLAGAGNDMRAARGLPLLPLAHFRPMVGTGARGMLGRALDIHPGHAQFDALREEFLQRYEARMTRETQVFSAMHAVIEALTRQRVPWGIVTNKITRYATPIVQALGLRDQARALVCGDTTPHAKPHPAPLLEGARQLGLAPTDCIYVGDDLRDVQAGHAAGMATIAAAWGYLGEGDAIDTWGADHVADSPAQLLKLLDLP